MARSINETDNFKERLLKLIPSEIIAAYIAIQALLIDSDTITIGIVISALVIITFLYLHKIEGVENIWHKLFATLSFPIWVYAVAPKSILGNEWYDPQQASIILILWTLLIPLFIQTHPKIQTQHGTIDQG